MCYFSHHAYDITSAIISFFNIYYTEYFFSLPRFDIDLSTPVIVNTLRAANLKVAWAKRQEELKVAMANVVKPAEFMADIALKLREKKQSLTESLDSLRELESLLGDIDNSRDYYTIG